jgi:hypothetical protein
MILYAGISGINDEAGDVITVSMKILGLYIESCSNFREKCGDLNMIPLCQQT